MSGEDWEYSEGDLLDRNDKPMGLGARIKFYPYDNEASHRRHGSKSRMGTVLLPHTIGHMVDVVLDGDPFGTYVPRSQVEFTGDYDREHHLIVSWRKGLRRDHPLKINDTKGNEGKMAKTTAKELRKQAKSLGVKNWEDMDYDELTAAVKKASKNGKSAKSSKTSKSEKTTKSSSKGKASKEKASKKSKSSDDEDDEDTGPNPYRQGTNSWHITEALMKGGKRSALVAKLKKKVDLKPRTKSKDFDEDAELDRRLMVFAQNLRNNHGFEYEKEGRGPDSYIKVTPPE